MTITSRLISLLFSALFLCPLSLRADVILTEGDEAREEFLQLQESAVFLDFKSHNEYIAVGGTHFIAFYVALNEKRTCLFGFHNNSMGADKVIDVETTFLCFPTKTFKLTVHQMGCGKGDPRCNKSPIDGISIGVGNLFPTDPDSLGGTWDDQGKILGIKFPKTIAIKFPKILEPMMNIPGEIIRD